MKPNNKKLNHNKGFDGENKAAKYLESIGYTILKRNYKVSAGEIDIIAQDKEYIVFVEVKYRKNIDYGNPIEAVDIRKQNKIRNVALYYLSEIGNDSFPMRFDVIGILDTKITHIKNAF